MIVLDTDVLLELMKPASSEVVLQWVTARPAASQYTTSVSQGEILHGLRTLPAGRRRTSLLSVAQAMFEEIFAGRILGFGSDAVQAYGLIAAERRRVGRPISHFDAQIAAIARSCGASIATRNVKDFVGCGIPILNPWET